MANADELYRRRHSDMSPKLKENRSGSQGSNIRNVRDLQNSLLKERSIKNTEVTTAPQHSYSSLYEEYVNIADENYHKAVERHRMKRKEDVVSRHTTFFPKKLNDEEELYAQSDGVPNADSKFCYDMTKFPRGILSLINEEMYYKSLECERRLGTDFDADELTSLFLNLGFIVQRYDNYTKKEIKMVLAKDAREDYTNMACCVCSVLSCGVGNEIYAIDKAVTINTITKSFHTGNLNGIPKIFLLNACRGTDFMEPSDSKGEVNDDASEPEETPDIPSEDTMSEMISLPPGDDFLYAHSTIAGFYSWRNNTRGSWFLQCIFSMFKANAHTMELTRMLTRVNKKVAKRLSRAGHVDSNKRRQLTSIISQLRDDLYLCPPYGPLLLKKISVKWGGQQ